MGGGEGEAACQSQPQKTASPAPTPQEPTRPLIHRQKQKDRKNMSKGVRECPRQKLRFYNLMSKATYHYYAGFFWSHRPSLIVGGDTECRNQEAGILGGHVGGCQPQ